MSVVQYKKYFWLVDTIRSAGKITKEQIDRKWRKCGGLNGKKGRNLRNTAEGRTETRN